MRTAKKFEKQERFVQIFEFYLEGHYRSIVFYQTVKCRIKIWNVFRYLVSEIGEDFLLFMYFDKTHKVNFLWCKKIKCFFFLRSKNIEKTYDNQSILLSVLGITGGLSLSKYNPYGARAVFWIRNVLLRIRSRSLNNLSRTRTQIVLFRQWLSRWQ
jgi:hypothetical protein